MDLRLLRHATFLLTLGGRRILVDPMFAAPSSLPALTFGETRARNPLVPLPPIDLSIVDLVVVTHGHFDHFDGAAERQLPRSVAVLAPSPLAARLRKRGFSGARALEPHNELPSLRVRRVPARHGSGLVGLAMGSGWGLVLEAPGEPRVYVTGDTLWVPEVEKPLDREQPDVVVAYAGAARFNVGAPITLDAEGVIGLCQRAPKAQVVAVHMEAINHCRLSRKALAERVRSEGLEARVHIPADGESLAFSKPAVPSAEVG